MKVRLVSKDPSLYRVCREALLCIPDRRCDYGTLPLWQPGCEADIWIWDCDGEIPPDSLLHEQSRIIFLIDRKKIDLFRDLLPLEVVRILLKPVRPRLLQDFLRQMLAQAPPLGADSATDRVRLERDMLLQHLSQANLTLQEYEQDRTGFLARTAHDLRAPLVAISGYCGMLLDRQLGPLNREQLSALEKMQHSVKRMTRLANGMLQIIMGRELESEPIMKLGDIHDLIQKAMGEVRPIAESKRLTLRADVTPPSSPLWFEPWQIEQVLVNLLDNACRLTPRGGSIHVKAYPTFWDWRAAHVTEAPVNGDRRSMNIQGPNAYRVEVCDTGPGLLKGNPGCDSKESASGSPRNVSLQVGLGLAICRQIISAHKGQVLIESGPRGATFTFLLPLVQKKATLPTLALHKVRTA